MHKSVNSSVTRKEPPRAGPGPDSTAALLPIAELVKICSRCRARGGASFRWRTCECADERKSLTKALGTSRTPRIRLRSSGEKNKRNIREKRHKLGPKRQRTPERSQLAAPARRKHARWRVHRLHLNAPRRGGVTGYTPEKVKGSSGGSCNTRLLCAAAESLGGVFKAEPSSGGAVPRLFFHS